MAAADGARHPIGVINTLSVAAFVEVFQRRPAETLAVTDRLIALAEEHGYPYFRAVGLILGGLALTMTSQDARGIDRMREGLAVHQTADTWQNQATYLILLAEALGEVGRTEEAFRALAESELVMARTGERYYEAGLHELRGQLLARQGDFAPAEESFSRAVDIARQQRAIAWESRVARSRSSFGSGGR